MKISIKINNLFDICYQYLMNIRFNPTSFSLIQKILDRGNYFFKKPQLSKLNNSQHSISNTVQLNEEHCSHDYSHMGFLDGCVVQEKHPNIIGIISNRLTSIPNSDASVLPVTQNHQTISLKEVYENLVKSNIAKLKTYQLFKKVYERSCEVDSVGIARNNSLDIEKSINHPLSELYPIHYFKNIEEFENYSSNYDSSKINTELQNLDSYDSGGAGCSLSIITNNSIKDELDSYCLNIDERIESEDGSASDKVGDIASPSLKDTNSVSFAASVATTLIDITMVNYNDVHKDVEKKGIVSDGFSEEMQTLVSNFSLNLKSVIDNNPIELTVKHQLFSVSYENNSYFFIKDTPHIGYNSLMELEQDKELMVFPLCFYIKSVSSTQNNTNHKLFFLLEEQIDEDNELLLNYVDNVHSGRIGLIYVSKSNIRKHYNVKRITQKIKDEVKLEAIKFVQLLNQ